MPGRPACCGACPNLPAPCSPALAPILPACSASDSDTTDEILHAALEHAKDMKLCRPGDCVVALHRIGNASGKRALGTPALPALRRPSDAERRSRLCRAAAAGALRGSCAACGGAGRQEQTTVRLCYLSARLATSSPFPSPGHPLIAVIKLVDIK